MNKFLITTCVVGAALLSNGVRAAEPAGDAAERKAALASFEALLDGLGKRDKTAMLKQILPGGSVTLMRQGKPLQMTLEALIDKLSEPGTEPRAERVHDALVRVDGDVAIIWAPFNFYLNGKVNHCGRDIATMVKVDGHWLISSIQDNNRTDCGAG